MKTFKFFWTTHKWTGILLSSILAMTAVTGFLLLIKKKVDWIQPPSAVAAEGSIDDFAPLQDVINAVLAESHPDFVTADDIDRIDTRPDKRLHKVRSKSNHTEYQVDAITAEILSGPHTRRSDFIETLHDGSFFGEWAHAWVMPATSTGLLFLTGSGLWLWLEPKWRRRQRRRRAQQNA